MRRNRDPLKWIKLPRWRGFHPSSLLLLFGIPLAMVPEFSFRWAEHSLLCRCVYYSTIQISFSNLKKEIGNHSVISIFHFQFEIRNQKSGSIFWFSFIIWNWKSEISFYFLIFILQSLKRNWKIENRLCRLY